MWRTLIVVPADETNLTGKWLTEKWLTGKWLTEKWHRLFFCSQFFCLPFFCSQFFCLTFFCLPFSCLPFSCPPFSCLPFFCLTFFCQPFSCQPFLCLATEPTINAKRRINRLSASVRARAGRLGQNIERELNFVLQLEQPTGYGDRPDVEISQPQLESALSAQFISLNRDRRINRDFARHAMQRQVARDSHLVSAFSR